MSMTREEIIHEYEAAVAAHAAAAAAGIKGAEKSYELFKAGLSALRPVSREPLEKFKEYFDDLYGKGLEVYGWHMNGEAKSFDDFYEDACEFGEVLKDGSTTD